MNLAETGSRYNTSSESRETRVLEAERRSWNYWTIDGIPNLVFGVACLCETVFLGLADKSTWLELIGLILFFIWIAILVFNRRIVESLKARTTYPRTGYAATPRGTTGFGAFPIPSLTGSEDALPSELARVRRSRTLKQWLYVVILLPVMLLPFKVQTPWICPVTTTLLGFLWWLMEQDLSQRRSWVVILGMPFVGFYMMVFEANRHGRIQALLAGLSVLLILDGALRLVRYMRRNPVARA